MPQRGDPSRGGARPAQRNRKPARVGRIAARVRRAPPPARVAAGGVGRCVVNPLYSYRLFTHVDTHVRTSGGTATAPRRRRHGEAPPERRPSGANGASGG